MMNEFTGYFDESYGKADDYSVAGYVATVEQWEGFGRDWRKFRKEEGFPVLHKSALETNVKGTPFEWPNLTDRVKANKKRELSAKPVGDAAVHSELFGERTCPPPVKAV